jgi:hypothetical protein
MKWPSKSGRSFSCGHDFSTYAKVLYRRKWIALRVQSFTHTHNQGVGATRRKVIWQQSASSGSQDGDALPENRLRGRWIAMRMQ